MVGGPYTTFTRGNCDGPGLFQTTGDEYFMHGTGYCQFMRHWPRASYQNAPVAIFIPGDNYGFETGWDAVTGIFTGKTLALAQAMSAAGWVVLSILYPPTGNNRHTIMGAVPGTAGAARLLGTIAEVHPVAMWPEQPAYVALAIQFIKSNFSGIAGPDLTPFGVRMFGAGNSIDPSKVVLVGMNHGATLAAYVALQPSGFYQFEQSPSHDNMDVYTPRASNIASACVLTNPMLDFTQFHIDRLYTSPAPAFFQGDKWGAFTRSEDKRFWHSLEMIHKRQSPWWALKQNYWQQGDIGFITEFTGTGYGNALWDKYLTAAQWSPGTVRDDTANAQAWIDPKNGTFQGRPWRAALSAWGTGLQGASGAKIRTSVTRYYDAIGDATPTASTSEYATLVMATLGNWGVAA